jgi:hypothetical protein
LDKHFLELDPKLIALGQHLTLRLYFLKTLSNLFILDEIDKYFKNKQPIKADVIDAIIMASFAVVT